MPAAPDTPYPIGDLTQTVSAVLLGKCAEHGQLNIDDPIGRWVTDFPNPSATVRQVLAHASDTASGRQFRYDEVRFAAPLGLVLGSLGWWALVVGLWLGFAIGAVVALRLKRRDESVASGRGYAFGPAMLGGAVLGAALLG